AIDGVEAVFSGPYFHEAVIRLPAPIDEVLPALAARNLLAGYPLGEHYPALQDCLLICATENRTAAEVASFAELLARVLEMRTRPQCPVQPKI
ncbi:MAG: glycine dehydrogenase, partial [Gammaproteobacteria bacterium]